MSINVKPVNGVPKKHEKSISLRNSLVSCDESGHTKFPFSSVILS